ncbi:MAG: type II toxin-antitoxin system PemK/MazF family toxin [Gemmataceae bacterium]|nr:type II toxin-antitoxin system PemK/MazF family toxin [Gemmataceae bacterium]MCI0737678.1 type II toxin-antitoxin system PemK/MazF family toxin [Gemmataceae bacterium]
MKRGDVWWVEFPGAIGAEIRKERPAVIMSNDVANRFLNRVQVVPLTSKLDKVFPSEAVVSFKGKKHKAVADQITTVAKSRLKNRKGKLSATDIGLVEEVIKVQLDLS